MSSQQSTPSLFCFPLRSLGFPHFCPLCNFEHRPRRSLAFLTCQLFISPLDRKVKAISCCDSCSPGPAGFLWPPRINSDGPDQPGFQTLCHGRPPRIRAPDPVSMKTMTLTLAGTPLLTSLSSRRRINALWKIIYHHLVKQKIHKPNNGVMSFLGSCPGEAGILWSPPGDPQTVAPKMEITQVPIDRRKGEAAME